MPSLERFPALRRYSWSEELVTWRRFDGDEWVIAWGLVGLDEEQGTGVVKLMPGAVVESAGHFAFSRAA